MRLTETEFLTSSLLVQEIFLIIVLSLELDTVQFFRTGIADSYEINITLHIHAYVNSSDLKAVTLDHSHDHKRFVNLSLFTVMHCERKKNYAKTQIVLTATYFV